MTASPTLPFRPSLQPDPSDLAPAPASHEANFREGIRLFNTGEYFDAHEVWEELWHDAAGKRKLFYQGLIQCAVTLLHFERGNPRGVVHLFDAALSKFHTVPDLYMGVDVPELLRAMLRIVDPVKSLPADRLAPGVPHGQDLPGDLARDAPRITLAHNPFAAE